MEIFCPNCRQKYNVPDTSAGKQAKCKNPACGQTFTITAPVSAQPTEPDIFAELPPVSMDAMPQAAAAPVAPAYRPPAKKKKGSGPLMLILGGGVAALLVLVVVVVVIASGGGTTITRRNAAPWDPKDYVFEDAKFLVCVDMESLHGSALYTEIHDSFEKKLGKHNKDFDFNQISKLLFVGTEFDSNNEPLIVMRMSVDLDMMKLMAEADRSQPIKNMNGFEYMVEKSKKGTETFVAILDTRTFCVISDFDLLKTTLARLERNERAQVSPQLKKALDDVPTDGNIYFAGVDVELPNPMNPNVKTKIDSFFGKFSSASGIGLSVTLCFGDEAIAKQFKLMIDGFLMAAMVSPIPEEMKKKIEPILSGLKINQEGNAVRFEASWPESLILPMLKEAAENQGQFNFSATP